MGVERGGVAGGDGGAVCGGARERRVGGREWRVGGATCIGPDAQPAVARIVIVRVPDRGWRLNATDAYLPEGGSPAADLARHGARITDPAQVDARLFAFLSGGPAGGLDQVSASAYRALVDLFDPLWIAQAAAAA